MLPGSIPSTSCNKSCIVFDLDDTLINTKQRHYKVYNTFLKSAQLSCITYKEYLKKRIEGRTNREILAMEHADLEFEFVDYWNKSIENEAYLKYDKIIVKSTLLEELKLTSGLDFILLSLRSNETSAKQQFSYLPFSRLFDKIYFVKHGKEKNPKTEVIKFIKSQYDIIFFTGDSLSDYLAAIENKIKFIGLDSGWRPLEIVDVYKNINQILKLKIDEFRERET